MVVAAVDGSIQEEADHATQRGVDYHLGIDVAGGGGV